MLASAAGDGYCRPRRTRCASADAATDFVPLDVPLLRSRRDATRATRLLVAFPPLLAIIHLL